MIRKYTKGLFVIVSLMMVFFLVGCGVGPGMGNTKIKDYHVGTQGINLVFFKANLKDVFEDDDVGRSVYIQNKGTFPIDSINNAVLTISYDEYFIALKDESPTKKERVITVLEGKDINNPLGGEDYYEYIFKAAPLTALRDTVDTTITYQLCYPYKTEMTTAVCIDTRKYTQDQSAPACKQSTYTSSSGQGAPMAITKIIPEISMKGNVTRPQFTIYISNKGSGYVINNTGANICSPENVAKRAENFGTVKVKAQLSGRELECSPSEIRLKKGDNIARCYVSNNDLQYYDRSTRNYVAPLSVELNYGYVVIEKEKITIKRLNDIRPDVEATSCGYYERVNSTGGCMSLCDYCRTQSPPYPQICAERLEQNNLTYFPFNDDFKCGCSKATCLAVRADGQCVFGFCPGDTYCCNSDECRGKQDNSTCGDHYVCRNNRCSDITMCISTFGTNYSCRTDTTCRNASTIEPGYCPGDEHNVCCRN